MKPTIVCREGKNGQRFSVSVDVWSGGKRKCISGGTHASRSEAERAGWELVLKYGDEESRAGVHLQTDLSTWVDEWLRIITSEVKVGTLHSYRQRMQKQVLPSLGKTRVVDLTPAQVRRWLDGLSLGYQSKKNSLGTLSVCLSAAVDRGLLQSNPCASVYLKQTKSQRKSAKERVRVWSYEDCKTLLGTGSVVVVLGLYGALRRGEICGVQWSDIDWLENTVAVRRNVVWDGAKWITDTPKSGESRTVRIPPAGMSVLALLKETSGASDADRLLPLTPRQLVEVFEKVCKSAGVPLLGLHALRHSAASLLLSGGAPITAVAAHLGHANPTITLSTYAHLMETDVGTCSDVLGRMEGDHLQTLTEEEVIDVSSLVNDPMVD